MPDYTPKGISYPLASDRVKDGAFAAKLADDLKSLATTADVAIDVGISSANAYTDERVWTKGRVTPATHPTLDSLPEGFSSIWSAGDAAAYGLPIEGNGVFNKYPYGSLSQITFMSFKNGETQLYASTRLSAAWSGWTRIGGPPNAAGSGSPMSGFKHVPLALGQQAAGDSEAVSAATVRWPVRYAAGAKRARLHVQNWRYYSGTKLPGAVSFTGAWFGKSSGPNFTGTPTKLLNSFTTPDDGAEYVSPWFNIELLPDTDQLLSVGFTNASGQTNVQSRSGCYRSGNASDASLASGFAGAASTTAPFDVWLEVEVPAIVPVICGFGDSNTVGTGTAFPTYDSWLSQYCRAAGALPYFLSVHGTTSASWADTTRSAWTHYEGTTLPDGAVYFLGQNDAVEGITLAKMKSNLADVLPLLRSKITPNVYAATITPADAKSGAVNAVRREYNAWLKTRPEGLLDCFDFSAAVSDDDATVRAIDSADGLHMRTSGHAKLAATLSTKPVAPPRPYAVEQAAGRTVRVWDYINDRYQLSYGDTGLRNISTQPNVVSGTVNVRRTSTGVTLAFFGVKLNGVGTVTLANIFPSGFWPDQWQEASTSPLAGEGARLSMRAASGDLIIYGVTAESVIRGTIRFDTSSTWPASLPGSAVGTIPY